MLQAHLAAIEPHQECSLLLIVANLGAVLFEELAYVIDVACDVLHHLVEPLFTLVVSHFESRCAEDVAATCVSAVALGVECCAKFLVGNDRNRRCQTCDVECLAGCSQRDGAVSQIVVERRNAAELIGFDDQVGVNLVRDDLHVVLATQLAYAQQLLLRKDATRRVVGRAEEQRLCTLQLAIEVLEIDLETTIDNPHRVVDQSAVILIDHICKWRIYRRLNHHAVAFVGQCTNCESKACHHTGREAEPLALDLPIVATLLPADDCVEIACGANAVAIHFVISTTNYGLGNFGHYLEIHIGDPHRDDVVASEYTQVFVEFDTSGPFTTRNRVEIILHI